MDFHNPPFSPRLPLKAANAGKKETAGRAELPVAYQFPSDLQELVGEQMKSGRYLTEDDLLRDALRALSIDQTDLDAVREAIAEWRAGDQGVSVDAAFGQLRLGRIKQPNRGGKPRLRLAFRLG